MAILHTVNTLSDDGAALKDCLNHIEIGDAIVFMEEAGKYDSIVNNSQYDTLNAISNPIYILPYEEQQKTNSNQHKKFNYIDYPKFVSLCCSFNLIQNWY